MKKKQLFLSSIITITVIILASMVVLADERINQAHHFGGDALYCDSSIGCWLLDSNGTQLWDISQATIDEAMELACETGTSEVIEAGIGTHGQFWFEISCYEGMDPSFTLVGTDEHGKVNSLPFSTNYAPVYGAPLVAETAEPEASVTAEVTPEVTASPPPSPCKIPPKPIPDTPATRCSL